MLKRFQKTLIIILALFFSFGIQHSVQAADTHQNDQKVIIYLFWGEGCPHCAQEKVFLQQLIQEYPQIELRTYELYYHEENRALFEEMAAAHGFEAAYVPTTFIGDQYWVGYVESVAEEIEQSVQTCLLNGCPDAGQGMAENYSPDLPAETPAENVEATAALDNETPVAPTATAASSNVEENPTGGSSNGTDKSAVLDIPLIGKVDLSQKSMLLSTVLISFVDGFNPCSLWVLSMLMALVIHTGSRKKIFIIGSIFLTITAVVYALFIAGVFSLLSFASFLPWIQAVVAVVSLIFALINIKDYFWCKEGVSLTISEKEKPGIFQRMRRVLDSSDTLWGLIGATIVLAGGVSLVEFSCTAGFPVLWSNLLTGAKVTHLDFAWLLLVYMVIYQLDEIFIFLSVVFTLRASKLEEKQGRILKLIGGTLMFTLAMVMITKPSLMNELSSSLVIFGIAIGAALLILLIHRQVLPAFGIWIGSEKKTSRKQVRRH